MNECLTEGCRSRSAADCRGLCMKCYSAANKLVTEGQTTWEELESMGLATPRSSSVFKTEFFKRKGSDAND
jgi:hypothetical protein